MATGQGFTNPASTPASWSNISKDITVFTVDYISAVNAKTGPESTQQACHRAIEARAHILAAGPLGNSNTEQTFIVEGVVDTAKIQEDIRLCGSVDSVDLAQATVTAKTLVIAV